MGVQGNWADGYLDKIFIPTGRELCYGQNCDNEESKSIKGKESKSIETKESNYLQLFDLWKSR